MSKFEENQALQIRVSELQSQLRQYDLQNTALSKQVAQAQETATKHMRIALKAVQEANVLKQQLAQANSFMDSYKTLLGDANKIIVRLGGQHVDVREHVHKLQKQIEAQ